MRSLSSSPFSPPSPLHVPLEFELDRVTLDEMLNNEASIALSSSKRDQEVSEAEREAATVVAVRVRIEPLPLVSPSRAEVEVGEEERIVNVILKVERVFLPHLLSRLSTHREKGDGGLVIEEMSDEVREDASRDHLVALNGRADISEAEKREEVESESDVDDESDEEAFAAATRIQPSTIDEEEDEETCAGPLKTRNEVDIHDMPLPLPFVIKENDDVLTCGTFQAQVDGFYIIECAKSRTLDIGSAICTSDRVPLGRVEEVFGPVQEPLYGVRPLELFARSGIQVAMGSPAFFVPSMSSFVLADSAPGSDASNVHDEEIEAEEAEFSDDEKEQMAKHTKKQFRNKDNRQRKIPSSSPSPQNCSNTNSNETNNAYLASVRNIPALAQPFQSHSITMSNPGMHFPAGVHQRYVSTSQRVSPHSQRSSPRSFHSSHQHRLSNPSPLPNRSEVSENIQQPSFAWKPMDTVPSNVPSLTESQPVRPFMYSFPVPAWSPVRITQAHSFTNHTNHYGSHHASSLSPLPTPPVYSVSNTNASVFTSSTLSTLPPPPGIRIRQPFPIT